VIEPTSAPLLFPFENKDDWLALIGRVLWLSHCLKVGRKLEVVGALHLALQLVRQFEAAITDPASASSWRPDREFRDQGAARCAGSVPEKTKRETNLPGLPEELLLTSANRWHLRRGWSI